MPNRVLVYFCAVIALVALLGALLLRPGPVRAASGTVSMATPLHDAPDPNATVIATLPEGTVVTIDGPPVDGFYPVTAGDLSGWTRGETLLLEKDAVAADPEGSPVPNESGEAAPEDQPAIEGGNDKDLAPPETPVDEPTTTPKMNEEPDRDRSPRADPDAGPVGPARVIADAPIRLGPGRDYERIATAPRGSSVEQTGHQINGYVTVQYAGVTGWAPLDHLGPPNTAAEGKDGPERPAKKRERAQRLADHPGPRRR